MLIVGVSLLLEASAWYSPIFLFSVPPAACIFFLKSGLMIFGTIRNHQKVLLIVCSAVARTFALLIKFCAVDPYTNHTTRVYPMVIPINSTKLINKPVKFDNDNSHHLRCKSLPMKPCLYLYFV